MNYGVGDTVVCIDSMPELNNEMDVPISAGKAYVVRSIGERCVTMVGVISNVFNFRVGCSECDAPDQQNHTHFHPWRFIKLDGALNSESEHTEKEIHA